jgi:hypothetical protein
VRVDVPALRGELRIGLGGAAVCSSPDLVAMLLVILVATTSLMEAIGAGDDTADKTGDSKSWLAPGIVVSLHVEVIDGVIIDVCCLVECEIGGVG